MTYKVGEELVEYLLSNGYKELTGDAYLKRFELKEYNPQRRRLFYTRTNKPYNWKYISFEWSNIVEYDTQLRVQEITKEKLDEIIKVQKSFK